MSEPGRVCPLRYRHGAGAIARSSTRRAQTLYVIGGLYGNVPALDTIEAMARIEPFAPTLCFNGDFNWFDIADRHFAEINLRVLANDAILGNVEAELGSAAADAGCGCAYPASVHTDVVERSNRIHAALKATAARHDAARIGAWARPRVYAPSRCSPPALPSRCSPAPGPGGSRWTCW